MEKELNYRIGLDIGISSVGWAVIAHDNNDNPIRIVDLGVRVFDAAENPKDGSSLAVDRRVARGNRRRLRRRAFRIELARNYLVKNLLDGEEIQKEHNFDLYELRNKAINKLISNKELYYVIIHFVKHRGFKSNRKSNQGKEDGKILKAINENKTEMLENNYRTIGEMIANDSKYFKINENTGTKEYFVRNHDKYENCFHRDDLEYELKMILECQQKFGNTKITDEFINAIINIFNKQRNFDDGPNEPSPYKSNFKVGNCTFEKNEKRAPKGTFSFEYFNVLQKINNLSYYDKNSQKTLISVEQKRYLIDFLLKKYKIDFCDVRKLLKLDPECRFVNLSYTIKNKKNEDNQEPLKSESDIVKEAEKKNLCKFEMVKQYAKVLNIPICKENKNIFNIIGYILSMRKSDEKRKDLLLNNGKDNLFNEENVSKELINSLNSITFSDEKVENLLKLETSKFCNLSFVALDKINTYLEMGYTYDKACKNAGYDFNILSATKKEKLKWKDLTEDGTNELQEITSPVVLRSVSQTIKVINAIIDKYGSPCAIYVELAREMAMNKNERNKLQKAMETRQAENEKFVAKLKDLGIVNPSGQDIIKYRLYEEQGGKSAYSGKSFIKELGSEKEIFNNNNTQIDHIMPYSKCFDDSLNNKVLVFSNENQEKGNRVPREYLKNEEDWNRFVNFVQSNPGYSKNERKKNRLLIESSNPSNLEELNQRALNDTKQASKFVLNMLKNHLIFKQSSLIKKPVIAVNGSITSFLRKIWGIQKIRFESDIHHAIDACVVACANDKTIQTITRYEKYKSLSKAKQKNVLIKQDGLYIDKITGETISVDEYNNYFSKWEDDYDLQNGKINLLTAPWVNFVKELEIRTNPNVLSDFNQQELIRLGYDTDELKDIKPLFVSRMPTRKVLGPIHKETIKSNRVYSEDNQKLIKRVDISTLTLDKNTGEIKDYAKFAKQSDPILYEALKNQLIKFNGNGAEAFKDKFYKPIICKDKSIKMGNEVKKVLIEETSSDFVVLDEQQNKVADKSKMVRIDIFKKDGKNYIVPIYVSDVYKQSLPNLAVPYKNKRYMDDKDFAFLLYPNDLVYMEKFNGEFKGKYVKSNSQNSGKPINVNKGFFYYSTTGIATGSCTFNNNDKSIIFENVGMQNIDIIEKYVVDVLGNYSKVKKEKRQPLLFKRKK